MPAETMTMLTTNDCQRRSSHLVHHEGGVEEKRCLVVVWHDATDEVGVGRVEGLNIKIRITNIVLY